MPMIWTKEMTQKSKFQQYFYQHIEMYIQTVTLPSAGNSQMYTSWANKLIEASIVLRILQYGTVNQPS